MTETPLQRARLHAKRSIPITSGASPTSSVMTAPVGPNAGERANVAVSVNGSVANNTLPD